MKIMAVLLACVAFGGCAASPGKPAAAAPAKRVEPASLLDARVPALLAQHKAAGAAVAVIRANRVVWRGYYGEQGPGVPVGPATLFNTASLAKTVTTETVLRLVRDGRLSLDEPIAAAWREPALADDPRYAKLTPRIILSHRSGLLNWPYDYDDGKLAFVRDPDTAFGYSGAAFDLLGRFLEKKFGMDFEALVRQTVFAPLHLDGIAMSRHAWMDRRVTTPMRADGTWGKAYTSDRVDPRLQGWSAADDLYVTLDDYAAFLLATMQAERADPLRGRVASSIADLDEWRCDPAPGTVCPERYGFGLGWLVFAYRDRLLVEAGGNDAGENAWVWYDLSSGDGAVVFVNGGNGIFVTAQVLGLVDESRPVGAYLDQLIARHLAAGGARR